MQSLETEDRRMFERLAARFPARYRDASGTYGTDVFLMDVSATGLRATTNQKFFIDDVISVEIKLPNSSKPLMLNGRVRWVRRAIDDLWETGVEFHRVNFMHINRLVRYALAAQAG